VETKQSRCRGRRALPRSGTYASSSRTPVLDAARQEAAIAAVNCFSAVSHRVSAEDLINRSFSQYAATS
jgi:hypothetical protein